MELIAAFIFGLSIVSGPVVMAILGFCDGDHG